MANPLGSVWNYFAGQGMGRALRHRDYRLFCITHWFSAVGFWVQRVGVGWLTWELTHSGAWLGIIAAMEALPIFIITPVAGAVADRTDRLRLFRNMVMVNMVMSGILAALTLSGHITIYMIAAVVAVNGSANAMALPARMTLAPGMVPREDVSAAIGLNSISFQLSAFIGPAIAGIIISLFGVGYGFAINSITYLVFVISLFCVTLRYEDRTPHASGSLISDTWDGLRYIARHASIGPMIVLTLAAAVFTRPFLDLLPGIADVIFQQGADGLATLYAAAGVGGTVAGLWLAHHGRNEHMTAMVLGSVLLTCLTLGAFAATGVFWIAVVLVAVAAAGMTLTSTGSQMLIQNAVDGAMRGRVMSIYGLTWRGAPALGALGMGVLSSWVGLQAPVAGGAVLCLVVWALTMPRRRVLAAGLERIAVVDTERQKT